jgi:hypothetical protein
MKPPIFLIYPSRQATARKIKHTHNYRKSTTQISDVKVIFQRDRTAMLIAKRRDWLELAFKTSGSLPLLRQNKAA